MVFDYFTYFVTVRYDASLIPISKNRGHLNIHFFHNFKLAISDGSQICKKKFKSYVHDSRSTFPTNLVKFWPIHFKNLSSRPILESKDVGLRWLVDQRRCNAHKVEKQMTKTD